MTWAGFGSSCGRTSADVLGMLGRRAALGIIMGLGLTACTAHPPAAAPVMAPVSATAPWVNEMLTSINAQRSAVGAGPLQLCASLGRAAADHTADQAMHNLMTHTGSDGSTMVIRVERAGYTGWSAVAENVAAGYQTVAAVMNGWMNSTGHRTNLLNPAYTDVGVGQVPSTGGTIYWTQDFGSSGTC